MTSVFRQRLLAMANCVASFVVSYTLNVFVVVSIDEPMTVYELLLAYGKTGGRHILHKWLLLTWTLGLYAECIANGD